jgi:small subunit ribosomal protein S3
MLTALPEALTVYGIIGIKVWVFVAKYSAKRDLTPSAVNESKGNDNRSRRNDH